MEDEEIVDLYWKRSEIAIAESEKKYGRYCHAIAYRILYSDEDAEECVNDTYLRAWGAIPPERPVRLSAFLGRITRNLALDRYVRSRAQKRKGETELLLIEMETCIPSGEGEISSDILLKETIDAFLRTLPSEARTVFLRRYWYLSTVREIARDYGLSESNVKIILHRTRNKLKAFLEKEGIII